ncbi:hypothetical protein SAMN02745146_3424 [Hymenobacter daecheongensis DSM 21074]|uniref:Uncharacterized protein n=1 Tax=Hymenobacter daecheongensis DSM 21074 TaxID=1121955 RepID=A0A1M6KGC9_9BACT|nr:hypothetical protein [Hymenobacter daecheongensis]SHJ57932.1 hypothetical protein SAMN02745146_3424 [Hymenobacter daecheongensis DSM 21074]
MPLSYRSLFYFESATAILLEIKRLDLPGEQDPNKLYHWLMFDKATGTLHPQDFVSMQAGAEVQEREFRQGRLRFTEQSATYVAHATGQALELAAAQPAQLPAALAQAIEAYLATLQPGSPR